MALRAGHRDPITGAFSVRVSVDAVSVDTGTQRAKRVWVGMSFGASQCAEQPTQNWSGPGESDCLIKTKHCDGRYRC